MAATSKTQLLTDVFNALKKHYKLTPRPERMTVLEAVIFAVCHEGTTREQANQALSRFKDEFFDWNEVRVSSLKEIQTVFAGLSNPADRADKVRRFLRQLFRNSYSFTLEALHKKPLKEAIKALQAYETLGSDYVLATVVQQALGGHAIPVDSALRRGLERLGVATPDMGPEALRSLLERAIPKNRAVEFCELMEELTHDTCVEGVPDCPRCVLLSLCAFGQSRVNNEAAAKPAKAKTARGAPSPTPSAPAAETAKAKAAAKASKPRSSKKSD